MGGVFGLYGPDLRIVDAEMWAAVRARLEYVRLAYGGRGGRPRGGSAAYSPYLLAGLLRCGVCGARMVAQTFTRKKAGVPYRYGWYRCGFAATKGAAVCSHVTGYRRDRLEQALLSRFQEAMTGEHLARMVHLVNAEVDALATARDSRAAEVKAEILRLEQESGNLLQFVREFGGSATVKAQLDEIESAMTALRGELATCEAEPLPLRRAVSPAWLRAKLKGLYALLQRDPVRAKAELAKHLAGDLVLTPLPGEGKERQAEIRGAARLDSLLAGQDIECRPLVAGAGFEPATFGL